MSKGKVEVNVNVSSLEPVKEFITTIKEAERAVVVGTKSEYQDFYLRVRNAIAKLDSDIKVATDKLDEDKVIHEDFFPALGLVDVGFTREQATMICDVCQYFGGKI